eukprot:2485112-Pleurochrysis_carterae.AAC.1
MHVASHAKEGGGGTPPSLLRVKAGREARARAHDLLERCAIEHAVKQGRGDWAHARAAVTLHE